VLVPHSTACALVGHWWGRHKRGREIRSALLVASSDTEARSYPVALRALLQCRCTSYHFRRSL
jgi:predicted alpha/beta hydrolase family esterase